MAGKAGKVAALVLAYNEEKPIKRTMRILNNLKSKGLINSVIVVDDGSTDKTRQVAEKLGAVVVSHSINRGMRPAFVTGANAARDAGADVILRLDADLMALPTRTVRKMLEGIGSGYHMVSAQQYELSSMALAKDPKKRLMGKVQRIESNSPRAISIKGLRPLFAGHERWVNALTADKQLAPDDPRLGFVEHQLQSLVKAGTLSKGDAARSLDEMTTDRMRWGLEFALERLVPKNKKLHIENAPVYTMRAFRMKSPTGAKGIIIEQDASRHFVADLARARGDVAKYLWNSRKARPGGAGKEAPRPGRAR